jgi:hypothetical protein
LPIDLDIEVFGGTRQKLTLTVNTSDTIGLSFPLFFPFVFSSPFFVFVWILLDFGFGGSFR